MKRLITYGVLFLFLGGCGSKRPYVKVNKNLGNLDTDILDLNLLAYHDNDSISTVYFEISNENILYKRSDSSAAFFSRLRISYLLSDEKDSKKISDSSTFYLSDRSESEYVKTKILYAKARLKVKLGGNYLLDIEAIDVNKKARYSTTLKINKLDHFSKQNFLVILNDTIAFKNTFTKGQQLSIIHRDGAGTGITVDAHTNQFGPAPPPFSSKLTEENHFKPDSSFQLGPRNGQFTVSMPSKGFYHLRMDVNSPTGLTLFTTEENFPGVSSSEEMINCTRYIMSRDEFDQCKNATDKKAAIDKFWLDVGGSNERARELLKRYYNRVKEANKRFTSYKEGWKTDRGLIFIVFGAPTNAYKARKDEVWVYGNESNPSAIRFVFNKASDIFSDNDYILERSVFYKEAYYQAVDYWRQGNVVSDNGR